MNGVVLDWVVRDGISEVTFELSPVGGEGAGSGREHTRWLTQHVQRPQGRNGPDEVG